MTRWAFLLLLPVLLAMPFREAIGQTPDEQSPPGSGGTVLQGGVSQDVFSTNTPPGPPPGPDAAPPFSGGTDIFSSNGQPGNGGGGTDIFNTNGSSDGGTTTVIDNSGGSVPTRLPCGMNSLEGQAWSGPVGNGFLGMLETVIPSCAEIFGASASRTTVCDARTGSTEGEGALPGRFGGLGRRRLHLEILQVQSQGTTPGLFIGGKRIDPASDKDYRCIIKFLTVPRASWKDPRFIKDQVAEIKAQLEDPLRRQIFDAMAYNPAPFKFTRLWGAVENVDIRVELVNFFGRTTRNFMFGSCRFTPGNPKIQSTSWISVPITTEDVAAGRTAPARRVLSSAVAADAHGAIEDFRNNQALLDCLGGVELSLFEAVDKIIGADRFNAEHGEGLQNIGLNDPDPPIDGANEDAPTTTGDAHGLSIYRNVKIFTRPTLRMMVPGDWVYMRNDPRYRTINRNNIGGWMGENTIYMGKYGVSLLGPGSYLTPADQGYSSSDSMRFSGLGGEADKTQGELAGDLRSHFQQELPAEPGPVKVAWTMLGRIKAGDDGPPAIGSP